jgi:hypothetical protein
MYARNNSTLLLTPNKLKIEHTLEHLLKTHKGLDVVMPMSLSTPVLAVVWRWTSQRSYEAIS